MKNTFCIVAKWIGISAEPIRKMCKSSLRKESYTPQKLWDDLKHDNVVKEIYPNCIYLLQLLLIFPISIACVEHLFSRMKLVKMRLHNQLKQTTLDSLSRIATESKLNGFTNGDFNHFVNELKQLNPNMRLKT